MNIAYLVNRYPAASHSFIRREIAAVEAAGGKVTRFSVRATDRDALPDHRDIAEVEKTIVLLSHGGSMLVLGMIKACITSPGRMWSCARIAFAHCNPRPKEWIRRVAYLAEAVLLVRMMKEHSVAHLHAHFGTNPAMVARIARKLGGPPYSFTVHGPDEFDQPILFDLGGKIADAAFCVAISSFGRSQLMRWSDPEHWPKIEVIRCGVDSMFIDDISLCPIPEAPRLSCVARLSAQKGIPLLIEAAAELKREGIPFELTLVGDGEMRTAIEESIKRNNLAGSISITGWASSDEVIGHLNATRAMVLPSFAEGLPVVIMEALALGRPVIVSAIAGTPELVDHECGWLVTAGSVSALVAAMKAALAIPPAQLEALGSIGRSRVIADYDSAKNGADLYRLIRHRHGVGDG